MLKNILSILILLHISIFANENIFIKDKANILKYAKILDKMYNVDKHIILAYIKTETNFDKFVISLKTSKANFTYKFYKSLYYKVKQSGKYVSIFPKDKDTARYAYDLMVNNKKAFGVIDYDLGLMQLNTRTIKRYKLDEKKLYLDFKENMLVGTDIIRGCYKMLANNSTMQNVVECYNRGPNKSWLNKSKRVYLARFMKNYNKIQNTKW